MLQIRAGLNSEAKTNRNHEHEFNCRCAMHPVIDSSD